MKYARYETHGNVAHGIVENDKVIEISAPPFLDYEVTDNSFLLSDVKLLAPTNPGKILAIGLNYRSHLGEVDTLAEIEAPPSPEPFLKAPSSVTNPGDPIVLPRESSKVQEEGELVVVIGKRCRNVSVGKALDNVLGYTCGNDVSDRNWQGNDLQWWRAKSSDTFAPIGPYIETDTDPGDTMLTARLNGVVVQESNTSQLIHNVPSIIEYISRVVTLEPGDAIFTGTPGSPVDINPGDIVEVEIEGIGILTNPVVPE